MDTYRKTLLLLKDLLYKSDNAHWEQWIDRDIYEWDNLKSTAHHKSAFGGMGSINDIAVGGQNISGAWQNNMFDLLKIISWTFAEKGKIDFPKISMSNIEGTMCRNCEHAEISERAIDHFLSLKYLPEIIEKNLQTENFLLLQNFHELTTQEIIVDERKKLRTAIPNYKIKIKINDGWLQTCPSCKSNDMVVYSWNVIYEQDKIQLNRSKHNLSLCSTRKKLNWLRRLIGYS